MNSRPGVTATTDMAVLPGVLGCRPLRRTIQVRLGTNPAVRLPGGTPIFLVSRQQLKLPAVPPRRDRESSKCKVFKPFYCSSLANPVRLRRTGGMRSLLHFHEISGQPSL